MDNTKMLNTRICLKYDSYSNWDTNNPTLLAGEIAIATLTNVAAVAPTEQDTQHPVLFKVGPGAFKDLPWASALAADVYSWAKKTEEEFISWVNTVIEHPVLTVVDETEGRFISDIAVEGHTITITRGEAAVTTISAGDHMGEITDNGTDGDHAYVINGKDWSDEIADVEIFEAGISTVNALGGIKANENLDGLTTRAILKKLLFPYVAQVVDNPSRVPNSTTLEKGNNQTITSVTVKVTKKSEAITSVALYDSSSNLLGEKTGTEVAAGGTFTFSGLSVEVPSTNVVLTVKVTDASGNVVSKNTTGWTFVYPYYYGVCASGATINETLVKGLTKKVESKGDKTWAFTANDQCAVFAYPKSHGNLVKILDQNSFDVTGSFTKHEISITGLDGTAQNYYVYVNSASTITDFKFTFDI